MRYGTLVLAGVTRGWPPAADAGRGPGCATWVAVATGLAAVACGCAGTCAWSRGSCSFEAARFGL